VPPPARRQSASCVWRSGAAGQAVPARYLGGAVLTSCPVRRGSTRALTVNSARFDATAQTIIIYNVILSGRPQPRASKHL
jgi:hypothetical protein